MGIQQKGVLLKATHPNCTLFTVEKILIRSIQRFR